MAPRKHWSSPDKQWSRRSGDMIANKYGNPMKLAGWIFLPSLAFMLAGCGDKDPKHTDDLSYSTHLAARYYEGPRPAGASTQTEAIQKIVSEARWERVCQSV